MTKLIPIKEVCEITGLKKSAIYQRIADGNLPKPIKIGRASRWPLAAIIGWVEEAIAEGKIK